MMKICRVDPPEERERILRDIVENHRAAEIDGVLMDAFTASMLVQILDKLNPTNQTKFLTMPIVMMAELGWKIVERMRES